MWTWRLSEEQPRLIKSSCLSCCRNWKDRNGKGPSREGWGEGSERRTGTRHGQVKSQYTVIRSCAHLFLKVLNLCSKNCPPPTPPNSRSLPWGYCESLCTKNATENCENYPGPSNPKTTQRSCTLFTHRLTHVGTGVAPCNAKALLGLHFDELRHGKHFPSLSATQATAQILRYLKTACAA